MSAYQDWALARTSRECQTDAHDACDGLAYDPEEQRVVACRCGCGHHVRGSE